MMDLDNFLSWGRDIGVFIGKPNLTSSVFPTTTVGYRFDSPMSDFNNVPADFISINKATYERIKSGAVSIKP